MHKFIRRFVPVLLFLLLTAVAGCDQKGPTDVALTLEPTPPGTSEITVEEGVSQLSPDEIRFITVATDAPARFKEFGDIDPFGNVIGFDPAIMDVLANVLDIDYEFVVTGYAGMLESVSNGEFDTAMSALLIPEQPLDGLLYTDPYLEVGQVLVILANNNDVQSYQDLSVGSLVGVQQFSSAEQTARGIVGILEPDVQLFESPSLAVQALIDHQVDGVILDNDDAEHYTTSYPQQLKIAGGLGRDAWITTKAYGIAVPEDNLALLNLLNGAIAQAKSMGSTDQLTQDWLVSQEPINAGESLVGTLAEELVIGMVGELSSLDPAARDRDLIGWEVRHNIMSGLLRYDAQNNLVPSLAEDFPAISEDKLEYTFRLRPDLTFPDGSKFTAEDVRYAITRAAGLGNFQVNRYLKDENEDGFADADSVQVVDEQTVKIVLAQPTSFFPSILATPPFSIISETCYTSNPDPSVTCGGLGPYKVAEWEPGVQMRLEANQEWPGEAPAFPNIQIRFYDGPTRMRRSLENNAVDIAWGGLSTADWQELRNDPEFRAWEGPPTFKSYLVFEQGESPWSSARLREAVAHAVDREALTEQIFQGIRTPLYSPVPNGTPGHIPVEPGRDLEIARSILTASGYSSNNKLEMAIWYVNDGRYTDLEEAYATALKSQIEETGSIAVAVEGAPWELFRPQSIDCNYPAFLLGWPSIDQPASYLDAMSWMDYFITNTDGICSNYESQAMTALYEEALEEVDESQRIELYHQIQELWAREFPTLDLTQEARVAISLPKVQNVVIDAMGLLHYDLLTKTE